jgi:hypothetical protein
LTGYRKHRGNAATLRANQSISERVAELKEKVAEKAIVKFGADIIATICMSGLPISPVIGY